MAEVAGVSGALVSLDMVKPLIGKIIPGGDLKHEIENLKGWHYSIQGYLEDHQTSRVEGRNWLKNKMVLVRGIAYDIEDVLDELVLHEIPRSSHSNQITWIAHKFAHHASHGFPLREIYKKIEKINGLIAVVKSQQETLPNAPSSSCSSPRPPPSSTLLPAGYLDLSTNLERERLIRLWVAEKFAVGKGSKTAEEVAEGYLKELIHKNLVHVSKRDFDGRPRNCQVQPPALEFITERCEDENFASIFPTESTQNQRIVRLSVHNDYTDLPPNTDFSGVRSMFLWRLLETSTPHLEKILRELKVARVLDFQGAPIAEFPKDITRLIHLRHLNFRGTRINIIPSSIEKLAYLETLNLKQTNVTKLPKEISHLHNLRHLFAYKYSGDNYLVFDSVQGVKISEGIKNLKHLQKLSVVKVEKKVRILEELKNLTKLRKLGLTGLKEGHGKWLSASIEHMPHLRTLGLCSNTKEEFLELGEMRNPPLKLERLYFKGRLKQLPSWISSLNNLLRIRLKWSKMQHSPLEALQHLPKLVEIELVDCYTGGELIFEASSFKKLESLLIDDFSQLHTIVIRNGAMPEVKQISLRRCPRMMILPLGMDNLTKVKELTLYDMAPEFIARLRKDGEDRAMVARIPLIDSFTLMNRSWSLEDLS